MCDETVFYKKICEETLIRAKHPCLLTTDYIFIFISIEPIDFKEDISMKRQGTFPFTAIIGQDTMKRALVLNVVNPKLGGVLIQGEKGTAKSTAVRALADLLPPRRCIKGCRFHDDPDDKANWCDECHENTTMQNRK